MKKNESTFTNVMKIFFSGIKIYILNFNKFIKYMAFPVLGQITGIAIIFTAAYFFTLKVGTITRISPLFDNILFVFLLLLVITLPGFFIFCKAFWDYLISVLALNSMASNIIEGGTLDDISIHVDMARRRSFQYVLLLLLLSIIYIIGSFPLFWVLLAIAAIYLSLTFQVFALEEDAMPIDAISMSVSFVKYNFPKTLLLLVLLLVSTYWVIPGIISWGFEAGNLAGFLSYPAEQFIKLLPIDGINLTLSQHHIPFKLESYELAKSAVLFVVGTAVCGFTLPLRSICCTILYKQIYAQNYAGKIAIEQTEEMTEKSSRKHL